ncbi:MAG: response regulator [Phaeodactylibacter sp.]|nr:response regulator [Phaeodactylibacter sp.]MCB9277060.1 response regulator [Lewinellaceae bacterium]
MFYLLLALACSVSPLFSQTEQYRFSHLTIDEGLSNNQVNCIYKDRFGFMWFGTMSGLNRFDGYHFRVFRNDPRDTFSIGDNYVLNLFEDHQGRLWADTRSGLNVFDPRSEKFYRYPQQWLDSLGLSGEAITKAYQSPDGHFWYLTSKNGIYEHRPGEDRLAHYLYRPQQDGPISSKSISDVREGPSGNLWAIHNNGLLVKLNRETGKAVYRNEYLYKKFKGRYLAYTLSVDSDGDVWAFASNDALGGYMLDVSNNEMLYFSTQSEQYRLNSNVVSGVVQDKNGHLWITTDGGGINVFDKKARSIKVVEHEQEERPSLSQNSITAVYQDEAGTIWIGTYKKGINYYHEAINKIRLVKYKSASPALPNCDDVNCFAEDAKGNLWIGTNGCGLLYFDRANDRFTHYLNDPGKANSLSSNVIVSLCIDHEQMLWIGTYYGGLQRFDGTNFHYYKNDPGNAHSLSDNRVWAIHEDAGNGLWVGTLGGGLELLDRKSNSFVHHRLGELSGVNSDFIFSLSEDRSGNMWVGTSNGVDVRLHDANRVVHYEHVPHDLTSLSNNNVIVVFNDSRGLSWVGTREGLNVFDPKKQAFTSFRMEDGLPDNTIQGIVEAPDGTLWISTQKGVSKMAVRQKENGGGYYGEFTNFDMSDGLQGTAFNENAAFLTSRGELVFGGANGFNIFYPKDLTANTSAESVPVLTDLQVFNKSIRPGDKLNNRALLNNTISQAREITLKHHENIFSLEFSSLDYLPMKKNKFAIKLEGFHEDWMVLNNESRRANFTNLDPGVYYFKVKAMQNDGAWGKETPPLKITVLPPFWQTPLAFLVYILLVVGALYLARQYILERERMKHRIATEYLEAQRVHEMDLMKIKFFTNTSHEFRTPLSLIISPLEAILNKPREESEKKQLAIVHRNAKRLLTLVNQLLDFRKMEAGKFTYMPRYCDMAGVIREVSDSFSDLAEKKNIRYSTSLEFEQLLMFFDRDKFEKILFNLLYNAFKFTPEKGEVSVLGALAEKEGQPFLSLEIKDTGIGISFDKQDKVFERFFQNDTGGNLVSQGSGIGLSIAKEFAEMHGGKISLASEPGKGSTFSVLIPVKVAEGRTDSVAEAEESHATDLISITTGSSDVLKKPQVLIVEDNEDFRFYLKENLKSYYHILEAENGAQGWRQALKHIPDLIVTDIMMPLLNGIELCKKAKSDNRTAHIPIILLSARNDEEQVQEGFETGADDYIIKPFNFEILHARIKNLIASRAAIRQIVQKRVEVTPDEMDVPSPELLLVRRATEMVENHFENTSYSVQDLSRGLGMSRVGLYKRLVAITGKTPTKFIRLIRLKKAAQLLEKSNMTVSEVAYTVGFGSPKQFSKYFKQEFDLLPSVYANIVKREQIQD